MIKLLMLRAVPLFLRPAAVLFEGAVIDNGHVLIFVLPIAAMALTLSSIPVHLEYFRSHSNHPDYGEKADKYISAISLLTLLSAIILIVTLSIIPLDLNGIIIAAICFTFISEKLADETSRALEFRKAFFKWFLIQALRSGWMFVPVLLALAGMSYAVMFLFLSLLSCGLMLATFRVVTGLRPTLKRIGLPLIRMNMVFLVGSVLPASYRQGPRIVVSSLFPDQAHIFLAIAQLCQGITLIYNVRFQVPYRKLIARRTMLFQRRLYPFIFKLIIAVWILTSGYIILAFMGSEMKFEGIILAIVLAPIMVAEALTFGVLSTYLGFLPWCVSRREALLTYLLCIASMGFVVFILVVTGFVNLLTLIMIPVLAIFIGMVWLFMILQRHFSYTQIHG